MKKTRIPAWAVLVIITLIAGVLLGATNQITSPLIVEQALATASAARLALMPDANSFREIALPEGSSLDNAYEALMGERVIGYTAQTTVKGYGGPIEIMCGLTPEGTITGITVGGSDFAETVGLGAKTKEPAFTSQFIAKTVPIKLGQDIDGVSGATISSSAVTGGVNQAVDALLTLFTPAGDAGPEDKVFGGLLPGATTSEEVLPPPEGVDQLWTSDAGCVVYVTKSGFNSSIQVQVGVLNDGSLGGVRISDEGFKETEGLGELVRANLFLKQFSGSRGPFVVGQTIDAVSGATISSTAVVSAVNTALAAAAEHIEGEVNVVETVIDAAAGATEETADGATGATEETTASPT